MPAERLYYGASALDFTAIVVDIRLDSKDVEGQLWQVALDRTAFYPEGGGQPWDTGTLTATAPSGAQLVVTVERVEEDGAGEVWHYVRKPLVVGAEVEGLVNAARRIDHEQQHSGQHLLSAMFWRELGAKTVSFHLGALHKGLGSSTIDLKLADGMERLSEEDLSRVEAAANVVVTEGRPLTAHWISRESADLMLSRGDLRKLPEREPPFRIVQMQGIEFNACGGTHVANTGAIGAVLVRKVDKVKQGWRVEFCCGTRSVRTAREDFRRVGEVAGMLSVGPADVAGRVEALIVKNKAAAKELKVLERELSQARAAKLEA